MSDGRSLSVSGSLGSWRWLFLALAAVLAVVLMPTAGSSQTLDANTLRLHVGTDGTSFTYTPASGAPVTQPIAPPTRCELTVTGPLASLTGTRKGPGLSGNGIGIKSGGSNGTPCGRVDSSEALTLGLVGVPAALSADLDLELKGGTRVLIETRKNGVVVDTFDVRAGDGVVAGQGVDGTMTEPYSVQVTSDDPSTAVDERIGNCRNASDAGPDSGARDNCRVTILPSSAFDQVTLKPVRGEVSLEGSGDFGDNVAFDTIFHLVDYDGEIDCGDTVTDDDGPIEGTITRYENTDGSDCVAKPYNLDVVASDPAEGGNESVTFEINDPGSQQAIYEATLVFDQPLTTPLSAVLQYDSAPPYDAFKQAPACEQDPFDVADDPAGSLNDEAIPAGHEACIVSVTQDWDGATTWHAIFAGDWKFR